MKDLRNNLERHMKELCLAAGSRHVGSPGEKIAADYIWNVFSDYGFTVRRESFPVTGWDFRSFELINVTRKTAVPDSTACFFSRPADVEGKLFWIYPDDVSKIDELPVAGRICMVEFWNGMAGVMGRNSIAEKLDDCGAAVAIFISNIHTSFAPSTKIERSPFLKKMGAAAVAQRGAYDLARHKDDVYRIRIDADCFDHTSENIIAGRPGNGSGKAVFGAHYDTAPLIQGAGDDAAGTAMLLELARLLKNGLPGWELDFAAFSAEEYIPENLPPGSGDYLARHGSEDIRWFMNFDDFGLLIGEPCIKVGFPEKLPPLAPRRYPFCAADQCGDDKGFHQAGIPDVWYYDRSPFHQLHTAEDTIDIIDFGKMVDGVTDAIALANDLCGKCD